MKRLLNSSPFVFILLAWAAACLYISCKKDNNGTAVALLQHKWQVVSLNGEALRYVGQPGDYFDFGSNKQLVRFLHNNYDTFHYQVIDGGKSLELYPFVNSAQTGGKLDLTIKALTSSQLVLANVPPTGPTISLLDSLRR